MRARLTLLFASLAIGSGPAFADYAAGKKAFDAWRMAQAATEFERASRAGDARASRHLVRMYGNGYVGEPKARRERSMEYLIRAAEAGDTEAKGRWGAALLAPTGGVRSPDGTWIWDVDKGIALLKISCEALHVEPCFRLWDIYAGGRYSFAQTRGLPASNVDEARRWGDQYRRALRSAAERGETSAMLSLAAKSPFWWITPGPPEERAMFAVLYAFATGSKLGKPRYLADIDDETYWKAVPGAEAWEIQRRRRPAEFESSRNVAARVANAIGWTDTADREDIERLALFAASGISLPVTSAAESPGGVFGDPARALAMELLPMVTRYFERRRALLESRALDASTWLTQALSESLAPRQLYLLDRFYASDLGRKLLAFERALMRTGLEAGIVLSQLRADPAAQSFGPDHASRLKGYARTNGIRMTLDERDDGAETRHRFVSRYQSNLRDINLRPLVAFGTPLYAGAAYEDSSRMLTPDEMEEIAAFRGAFIETGAYRALLQLQAVRGQDPELAELERQAGADLMDRVTALQQRSR